MNRMEQLHTLNQLLLTEMPEYQGQAASFPQEEVAQRRLLRSLMNLRPPMPLKKDFLSLQDQVLAAERDAKGVVAAESLPPLANHPKLALWQGDITVWRLMPLSTPPTAPSWAVLPLPWLY